jgi:hypothetical protein
MAPQCALQDKGKLFPSRFDTQGRIMEILNANPNCTPMLKREIKPSFFYLAGPIRQIHSTQILKLCWANGRAIRSKSSTSLLRYGWFAGFPLLSLPDWSSCPVVGEVF